MASATVGNVSRRENLAEATH